MLVYTIVHIIYYLIVSLTAGHASLTSGVVIDIVVALGAVDPQKHLVVVVLVPVEGQDPGAPSLWVPTEEARQAGHQLGE